MLLGKITIEHVGLRMGWGGELNGAGIAEGMTEGYASMDFLLFVFVEGARPFVTALKTSCQISIHH